MYRQDYPTYYKDYFKTPAGKQAKHKATKRYRDKIAKQYGMPYYKAMKLHKERIRAQQ